MCSMNHTSFAEHHNAGCFNALFTDPCTEISSVKNGCKMKLLMTARNILRQELSDCSQTTFAHHRVENVEGPIRLWNDRQDYFIRVGFVRFHEYNLAISKTTKKAFKQIDVNTLPGCDPKTSFLDGNRQLLNCSLYSDFDRFRKICVELNARTIWSILHARSEAIECIRRKHHHTQEWITLKVTSHGGRLQLDKSITKLSVMFVRNARGHHTRRNSIPERNASHVESMKNMLRKEKTEMGTKEIKKCLPSSFRDKCGIRCTFLWGQICQCQLDWERFEIAHRNEWMMKQENPSFVASFNNGKRNVLFVTNQEKLWNFSSYLTGGSDRHAWCDCDPTISLQKKEFSVSPE